MCKLSFEPFYTIVSLGKGDDWERLKITVHLPLDKGYFEQVQFNVTRVEDVGWKGGTYHIFHKENDGENSIFENEITVKRSECYCYYFSCKCNGEHKTF